MARSLWTGSLSFGLVNVPVALYTAAKDLDVHFHQLHEKDGARIEVRRFCSKEDKEVPLEAIGHGYEMKSGKQVVLTDADLEAVAPRRTRTIEIESFADRSEIDPILFDHPYWLAPVGDSEGPRQAYRLLVEVMADTDRVALGRFVLRSREYLAAIQVRDGHLALTTMLFADEIRSVKGVEQGGRKPSRQALGEAVKLIDSLSEEFDPGHYEDRYRTRLRAVIKDKKKGATITAPEQEPEPDPASDLMEALRQTIRDLEGKNGSGSGSGKALKRPAHAASR